MTNAADSYTAASRYPAKIVRQAAAVRGEGGLRPLHVQICPTNKCNLNCAFCSCAGREHGAELTVQECARLMATLAQLGTRALTVTGGGEPLMHKQLGDILSLAFSHGIEVGLVSNGFLLKRLSSAVLGRCTWCRISCGDDRDMDRLIEAIALAVAKAPRVDWAFSYVVTAAADVEKMAKAIDFANGHRFTHVRLVSDLLDPENVPRMMDLRQQLHDKGVDDSRVIYQGRKEWEQGVYDCRASLVKPLIAADGYVYPCCGAQYAIEGTEGEFPEQMRMCHMSEIAEYWAAQKPFDGSVCDRCYYDDYNELLRKMATPLNHEVFV
jgi:MoaA/NifB/PqqE/SkfB family radical SAM enzyme